MSANRIEYHESYRAAVAQLQRLYSGRDHDFKRKLRAFRAAYATQPDDATRDEYAQRFAEAKAREVRR